jgi:hypothetical protein
LRSYFAKRAALVSLVFVLHSLSTFVLHRVPLVDLRYTHITSRKLGGTAKRLRPIRRPLLVYFCAIVLACPLTVHLLATVTHAKRAQRSVAAPSAGRTYAVPFLGQGGMPTATPTLIPTAPPTWTATATTMPPISTPTPTPLPTPTATPPIDIDGDSDFDGIADPVECPTGAACPDSDGDGLADYRDIDSDGDGIPDRIEAVVVVVRDWRVQPVDLDGDGLPDYLDPDSDNDSVLDALEGHDANFDGVADRVAMGVDRDDDGLDDAFDTVDGGHSQVNAAGSNAALANASGGLPNWRNADDDGDAIPTIEEIGRNRALPIDEDGNGTPDYLQPRVVLYTFLPLLNR